MMYTWLRHTNQLPKPERKFKFHQAKVNFEPNRNDSSDNDKQLVNTDK